jgi:leucyl-tRNA synthetase
LEFSDKCKKAKAREEIDLLGKDGVFTGKYAENPLTGDKVPVWAGNFVVAEYGSGMVMAVPAHDQRDFEFATKYDIPIKIVIQPKGSKLNTKQMDKAFVDEGVLVDSDKFTNVGSLEAIEKISDFIEKSKFGHRTVNYKLRDWLISRQRYWGTPIPIIYCNKCGAVPVPEKELPVLLPEDVKFGDKGNPLLTSKKFQEVKCPKCKAKARRETDTMGGFMDSSWYFLRFCSPQETNKPFTSESVSYWMPVNQYIGGIEHAVGHLIYARFFTKALRDLGFLKFDEPFSSLFNQGIVYKDGKKMSKSFGNVVTQDEISSKYGIDTARLFLLFLASPEKQVEWNDDGVEGMSRFVRKVIALAEKVKANKNKTSKKLEHYTNKAILEVTSDIENFRFNIAIIKLMSFANYLEKEINKESYETLLKLLSPFAPHVSEELWHQIGNKTFVSVESWPKADENKIDDSFELEEKLIGNITSDVRDVMALANIAKPKKVIFIIADDWKVDFLKAVKLELEKTRNPGEIMKRIMSSDKLKKYGGDISKLVPKLVADPGRIPAALFGQKEEMKIFLAAKSNLEAEIGCKIEIIAEKESKHPKAKQSFPGKPAIVIE